METRGDGGGMCLRKVRDGPRGFLVEREHLEALGGGDGDGVGEEIDALAVGGDVEVVVVAEEVGLAAEEPARAGGRGGVLLVDGFEDFEDGGAGLALLVEDERAVFHFADREETDVSVP